MPPPRPIIIREIKRKKDVANVAAVISAVAVIVAATITATGTYASAVITTRTASTAHDWRREATAAGWAPKSDCEWQSVPTIGTDSAGRQVQVLIHLLAAEYRWVYGSANAIELGGDTASLAEHIRNLALDSKAKYVVAVGMASVEGGVSSQSLLLRGVSSQSALAEARTDKLIRVIKDEVQPRIPVHGLSLGRFRDEHTRGDVALTASQRRVVVLEVLEHAPGVALGDAVYDALRQARLADPPIPIDVTEYSDQQYTDYQFGRRIHKTRT